MKKRVRRGHKEKEERDKGNVLTQRKWRAEGAEE
jgi:hypothetical protein